MTSDDDLIARVREAIDQLPKLSYGSDDEPDFRPTSFETKGLEALDTLARRLEERTDAIKEARAVALGSLQAAASNRSSNDYAAFDHINGILRRSLLHPEPPEETESPSERTEE